MCNRWMLLFTACFWGTVFAVVGWKGIGIIILFSICIMVVVFIRQRMVKHD